MNYIIIGKGSSKSTSGMRVFHINNYYTSIAQQYYRFFYLTLASYLQRNRLDACKHRMKFRDCLKERSLGGILLEITIEHCVLKVHYKEHFTQLS